MRVRWKKLFLWSSLGSITLALAVSVARKTGKRAPAALRFQRIPPDCSSLTIRTGAFSVEQGGNRSLVSDEYALQKTSFKVWNVLELQPQPAAVNLQGTVIYHVSQIRRRHTPGTAKDSELVERFYGTIRSVSPDSPAPRKDELARGAILEIARCYVGGASNGVETGEMHRSGAAVSDFAFHRTHPKDPSAAPESPVS